MGGPGSGRKKGVNFNSKKSIRESNKSSYLNRKKEAKKYGGETKDSFKRNTKGNRM